jgi:hypothetical protein
MTERPQKVTFGEMRDMGVRGILIYCADYKCSHWIRLSADQWPDDMRLSDIEDRFTCTACVPMSGRISIGRVKETGLLDCETRRGPRKSATLPSAANRAVPKAGMPGSFSSLRSQSIPARPLAPSIRTRPLLRSH